MDPIACVLNTETAMLSEAEKFRSPVEGCGTALAICDLKGKLTYVNQATAELLGYTVDELMGRSFKDFLHSHDKKKILSLFPNSFLLRRQPRELDLRVVRRDGEALIVPRQIETDATDTHHVMHCSITPLHDEKGNIQFLVSIKDDVTQSKRMETIAQLREKLRRSPDISSGLNLLLNSVINDYQMDLGAVLLADHDAKSIQVRGFKTSVKDTHVTERFPFDKQYSEVQAYLAKKSLSIIVGENKKSIFDVSSIHCAPINFRRKKHGMLCLGSRRKLILSESDLSELSLYSELFSTLFELQNIQVAPLKEISRIIDRRFKLKPSNSYLILNDLEKSFDIFVDSVLSGVEGLCITRIFPPKIREKYGLEKIPILLLSEEKIEREKTLYLLQDISIILGEFLERVKDSIVLLDGFEYLITNHGFNSVLRFLQITRTRIEQNNSIFLAPLFSEALDPKEVKLIEREMTQLSSYISEIGKRYCSKCGSSMIRLGWADSINRRNDIR